MGAHAKWKKSEKTDFLLFGFSDQAEVLKERGSLFDDENFLIQHLLQQDRSLEQRLQHLEGEVNLLKTTRPHVEQPNKQSDLFQELIANYEKLAADFDRLDLRLNNLIDLKNTLYDFDKKLSRIGDSYLHRAIVVFLDSIKHAQAEDINWKQLRIISEVVHLISKKTINKKIFREIYKKFLKNKFQIIPEPISQ